MFIKASRLRAHSSCQNLDCPSGRRPLIRSRTLGFLVSSAAPGGVQAAGSEDEDEDDAKRVVVGAMVIPGGHTLDTRAASAVAAGLRANIRSCSLSLSRGRCKVWDSWGSFYFRCVAASCDLLLDSLGLSPRTRAGAKRTPGLWWF